MASDKRVVWAEDEHETASFLAVVPPATHCEGIARLQRASGVAASFLPHITVKGQPGLGHPERWVGAVRDALAEEPEIVVGFDGVGSFGDDIVFLRPAGDDIRRVHFVILDALARAGIMERWEYDGDEFQPHLTVGAVFAGDNRETLRSLATAASQLELSPFVVSEIIEFHRPAPGAAYEPRQRFALQV